MGGPELSLLLMETYREEDVHSFYRGLRQRRGAMGLVSWFRLRTFCISSLYSPTYRTPCHFCDMGWESRAKSGGQGTHALRDLLRKFEGEGAHPIETHLLRPADRIVASAYLVHLVEGLTSLAQDRLFQDAVTVRRELQLDGLVSSQQASAHWPSCDCQYVPASEGRARLCVAAFSLMGET